MRSNAMKTCAVGALLFGGTLGASAQAATVIDNFATGFGGSGTTKTQSGAGILGTRTVRNFDGIALSFSNPGMGWTGSMYNFSSVGYSNFGTLDFTSRTLTMTGSGSAAGISLGVTLLDATNRRGSWVAAFGNTINLSTSSFTQQDAGFDVASITSILLQCSGSYTGSVNYTMTNFSYSAVPAPGAAALVGLAGLVGRRRRRN
jgi:MYXO-CTERM domain-containing protein